MSQPRKTQRVRIDAITNAIRKGEYDDQLPQIRAALEDRLAHKRAEVEKLVAEVYGDDYTITPKRAEMTVPPSVAAAPPPPEGWVDNTADLAPEAQQAGTVTVQGEGVVHTGDPEDDPAFESRSPIIGGLPQ